MAQPTIVSDFGPMLVLYRNGAGTWYVKGQRKNCCHRVLAYSGKRRVGSLCYERRAREVHTIGTFVSPSWRKRGLAERLWAEMIRRERPRALVVTVVSDRGLSLVSSMRRRYRRIHWRVTEDGWRKLRDKRGAA